MKQNRKQYDCVGRMAVGMHGNFLFQIEMIVLDQGCACKFHSWSNLHYVYDI